MKSPKATRGNQRGQALLQVLGVIAIIGFVISMISDTIARHRSQVIRNADKIHVRLALRSALEYAIYGVRQRWCFSDNLVADPDCTLSHPASTERLIMSDEGLVYLRQMVAANLLTLPFDVSQVPIDTFEREIIVSNVSPKHPLFNVVRRLSMKGLLGLKVKFERSRSAFLPTFGREAYVRVTASLIWDTSLPLQDRSSNAISSFVSIHPREVGTFALIVAKDLRMDKGYRDRVDNGDAVIHQFPGSSLVQGRGLVFQSPVFVNHDIHLPGADDRTSSDVVYAAVTFADKVIQGDGRLYERANVYSPSSAGGSKDRLWSDNHLFGGFQKGLENDGARDAGLDALAGITAAPANTDLMRKCIELNLARSSNEELRKSSLFSRALPPIGDVWPYRVGVTRSNQLNPQVNFSMPIELNGWPGAELRSGENTVKDAVLELRIFAGDKSVRVPMPTVGEIKIELPKELANTTPAPPPEAPVILTLRTSSVEAEDFVQKNKVDLKLQIENPGKLGSFSNPKDLQVRIHAYDLTYQNGALIGQNPNDKLDGFLTFRWDADAKEFKRATQLTSDADGANVVAAVEDVTNYDKLSNDCENNRHASSGSAFGGADWDNSFAESARSSWNFAGIANQAPPVDTTAPLIAELIFDENNSKRSRSPLFQVHSIVGTCRIKASADFVTGFLTCDKLIIEERSTPLRIIGTFIVSGLQIDPSAYKAGITWSSIYHAQATPELRAAGILRSRSGRDCAAIGSTASPLWHPIPSIQEVADRFSCNTISLRAKANPFQWTAVDPDCGRLPNSSSTTCKRRLVRFVILAHSEDQQ